MLEKCEKKTEPLEQPPQNQMDNNEIQTILIEDDDDDGDDVGDSIINVTQNIPIDNESSVLHTPEYSPHTSPLQSSSCTIQTASSSTNQPSTSQGPNNASHRFVFSLFSIIVACACFCFEPKNQVHLYDAVRNQFLLKMHTLVLYLKQKSSHRLIRIKLT